MGKYELICSKIRTIDGGTFQALACRYVRNTLHISEFNDLGMSFGSTKPALGTPDSYLIKPDGHLVFVECGHYSDHSAALRKLRDDIEGCLRKERESIVPNGLVLDEIVCCYGYERFKPEELALIKTTTDSRVVLVGPCVLAEACCSRYPWLASEYLGISLGTGSILDVDSFVSKNEMDAFAPSMKHKLIGRDTEITSLVDLVLNRQVTVVTGDSGCGKTRICLEACEKAANAIDAMLYIVPSTKESLYDDLSTYCSCDEPIILMLDDANELTALRAVVEYVLTRDNIKLVATVRSYAKGPVMRELQRIKSFGELPLTRPNAEQVSAIIGTSFGIKGNRLIEHLGKITRGNLRLAFLAAESARLNLASIVSVKELFDAVYRDKLDTFDETTRKTICMASLLGAHRTYDNENLEKLLDMFGLSGNEYLNACGVLHTHELMDVAGRFEAVSFEEQNLRDYFIYRTLVDLEVVTVPDLWALEGGRELCVRACQIVSDVYGDELTIKVLKEQALKLLRGVSAEERLLVVDAFGTLLGIEGLLAIQEYLKGLREAYSLSSSIEVFDFSKNRTQGSLSHAVFLATARYLESPVYAKYAVDTLLEALRRIDATDTDLEELFQRRLNLESYVQVDSFDVQEYVLDLFGREHSYHDQHLRAICLILFAKGLLQDEISLTQWNDDRALTFIRNQLRYSQKLNELRKRCLEYLADLYECPHWRREVERTVLGYTSSTCEPRLAEATLKIIRDVFLPVLRLDTFESCERLAQYGRLYVSRTKGIDSFGALLDNDRVLAVDVIGGQVIEPTIEESLSFTLSKAQSLAIAVAEVSLSLHVRTGLARDCLIQRSMELTLPDWEDFFALLRDCDQAVSCAYEIDGLLRELWVTERLNSSIRNVIVEGYIGSCLKPGSFAEICAAHLYNSKGYADGRTTLTSLTASRRGEWSAVYDTYAIGRGVDIGIADVVKRADDEGEIIPFEAVCRAERLAPGFFSTYLDVLTSLIQSRRMGLQFYLPYSSDELDRMLDNVDLTGDNSRALECLVLELYCADRHGALDEIAEYLLMKNAQLGPSFVDAFIKGGRSYRAFGLGKQIVASTTFKEAIASLGELLTDDSNHIKTWHQRRMVLKTLLVEAYAMGRDDEVDEWVVSESLDEAHRLSSVTKDVIPTLPYERRAALAIMLAEAGIEGDAFGDIVFGLGFESTGWFGSEIPLLREQLAYYEDLEKRLTDRQLWDYVRLVHEAAVAQAQRIHQTEVKEFTDPYLRQ